MRTYELNMDGLVGPTHHYAGLAFGNIASTTHARTVSNPRAAAKQGLKKMRLLHSLGIQQGLLPPHQRPNLQLLYNLGFTGKPEQQLSKAYKVAPELLSVCYSASSMWTANAATVSPSIDTLDNKVHFTAANLLCNLHRSQEAKFTQHVLQQIFNDKKYFIHHSPLPASYTLSDEGAANHNRLCQNHAQPGVHLFVYGKTTFNKNPQHPIPGIYPARQALEASQAIARNHLLPTDRVIFAYQNPDAIDQGVFHNDVISVTNESVYLVHEQAFYNQAAILDSLRKTADFPLTIIEISQDQLCLKEAVSSYLFNSQLITLQNEHMALIAPIECEQTFRVKNCIDAILVDKKNPINTVYYLDLKQSMRNGGGPACLRLRVPVNEQELSGMHQGVLLNDNLLDILDNWVSTHYREELHSDDLADPQLMLESFQALDELTRILKLGSLYPFQQEN